MSYTSDKRLYLTADGQVVEEGDERAATLLVGEGGQLSDEQAAQYGLTGKRRKATAEAPADASKSSGDVPAAEPAHGSESAKSAAPSTKAIAAPEGNK